MVWRRRVKNDPSAGFTLKSAGKAEGSPVPVPSYVIVSAYVTSVVSSMPSILSVEHQYGLVLLTSRSILVLFSAETLPFRRCHQMPQYPFSGFLLNGEGAIHDLCFSARRFE
jgi:hypothetical protein